MSDADFEKKQQDECDKNGGVIVLTRHGQDVAGLIETGKEIESSMALSSANAPTPAIQQLLDAALLKSSTLQLTPDEAKKLTADFGDECFRRGANGDTNLIYLEHKFLQDRLNEVIGIGQYRKVIIKDWNEGFQVPAKAGKPAYQATRIYIKMALLVRGCLVGEGIGEAEYYPTNASGSYGKSFESAKTAAFRLCLKEFGIGLQPYSKDFCDGWKEKYKNFERPERSK